MTPNKQKFLIVPKKIEEDRGVGGSATLPRSQSSCCSSPMLLRSQDEHFDLDQAVQLFELARGCRFEDRQLLDGLEMLAEQQRDV